MAKLSFVKKDAAEGTTPFAYPYHGSGYGDDANLYFYLPHGKYRCSDSNSENLGEYEVERRIPSRRQRAVQDRVVLQVQW